MRIKREVAQVYNGQKTLREMVNLQKAEHQKVEHQNVNHYCDCNQSSKGEPGLNVMKPFKAVNYEYS